MCAGASTGRATCWRCFCTSRCRCWPSTSRGDDGTALIFAGIGVVMLFAGGLSLPLALGGLGLAAAGGAALLLAKPDLLKGYQFQRILAVLTPEDPALADIAYQQNKAAMAIGTGGLTGQGLFQDESIFIPNAWNDFIYSYLANALGLFGRAGCAGAAVRHHAAHAAHGRRQRGPAGAAAGHRRVCGVVLAVRHQHRHEPAGAAGHRRHVAVLLGWAAPVC